MDCVMRELVQLDKSGVCPYAGAKCDGTLKLNWKKEYALIPESKVCLSQAKSSAFIEVEPSDIDKVSIGDAVLMIRTDANHAIFVRCKE